MAIEIKTKNTNEMTDSELKIDYKTLRRNACHTSTIDEWESEVGRLAHQFADGDDPYPIEWVDAARIATTLCQTCDGTGFRFASHNKGNDDVISSGKCFRCGGKGRQNQEDYRRNYGHDRYKSKSTV